MVKEIYRGRFSRNKKYMYFSYVADIRLISTAICIVNAYGLSKHLSQRDSPELQKISSTPFAVRGAYVPILTLSPSNCTRTKARVVELREAHTPRTTNGHSMNLSISREERPSLIRCSKSLPKVIIWSRNGATSGKTFRLCNERMQYKAAAAR